MEPNLDEANFNGGEFCLAGICVGGNEGSLGDVDFEQLTDRWCRF